jgi:hypothetical protein
MTFSIVACANTSFWSLMCEQSADGRPNEDVILVAIPMWGLGSLSNNGLSL